MHLLEKETLSYEEVESLIGPPPFGKKNLIAPDEFEVAVNTQAGVPSSTPPSEPVEGSTQNNSSPPEPKKQV